MSNIRSFDTQNKVQLLSIHQPFISRFKKLARGLIDGMRGEGSSADLERSKSAARTRKTSESALLEIYGVKPAAGVADLLMAARRDRLWGTSAKRERIIARTNSNLG
ncbi:hypothetical protein BH11PSE11_BH11PSE11_32960 [soil metagenome]